MQATKNRTKALKWKPTGEKFVEETLHDAVRREANCKRRNEPEPRAQFGKHRIIVQSVTVEYPIGARVQNQDNEAGVLIGGNEEYGVVLLDEGTLFTEQWRFIEPEGWGAAHSAEPSYGCPFFDTVPDTVDMLAKAQSASYAEGGPSRATLQKIGEAAVKILGHYFTPRLATMPGEEEQDD